MIGDFLSPQEKIEELGKLSKKIKDCTNCSLCETRKNTVSGAGSPLAKILIIGEAPGEEEDEMGLPFVGDSGKYLHKALGLVGIKEEDIYIVNVLKCRPKANRDPKGDEIKECFPFLQRQVDILAPELVLTLGTYASQLILDTEYGISELRTENPYFDVPFEYGIEKFTNLSVIATFHPSFVLRKPEYSKIWLHDLKKAAQTLRISNFVREQ